MLEENARPFTGATSGGMAFQADHPSPFPVHQRWCTVSPTATAISWWESSFDPAATAVTRPRGSGMSCQSDELGSGQYQRCRSRLSETRAKTSIWPSVSEDAAMGTTACRGRVPQCRPPGPGRGAGPPHAHCRSRAVPRASAFVGGNSESDLNAVKPCQQFDAALRTSRIVSSLSLSLTVALPGPKSTRPVPPMTTWRTIVMSLPDMPESGPLKIRLMISCAAWVASWPTAAIMPDSRPAPVGPALPGGGQR